MLQVRAKAEFETTKKGGESIVISEIPFMVNKSGMLERMAELVRDGKIDGVSDIRDESNGFLWGSARQGSPCGHAR